MAEDADINVLMRRYGITGKMPENPEEITAAMYGDFTTTGITDYRSAVEAVAKAHEGFMLFPAEIRARYDNDPQQFVEWVNNPQNADEARKFGLVKPKPAAWEPSPDTKAIITAVEKTNAKTETKPA
jgi:phage internal scaffolding protein